MDLIEVGTGYSYSTLQAASNAALSGGTVRANANATNIYAEAVLINNKRIRLIGALPNQGIRIAGAGAGASPALQVTGTGGVCLENFLITNVGSTATYIVQFNVAEDWISRCKIDGNNAKYCLLAQYADNCLLQNGARAFVPSCPGQVILRHVTCVNFSYTGLYGNTNTGDFKGCLTYNCNNAGFLNGFAQYCCWNFGDDGTPPGALSKPRMSLADIAFANYAGGDFSLTLASKAWINGVAILPDDITGKRRLRSGPMNRIYGGCYEPFPVLPYWLSGASSLRTIVP